MEKVPNRLIKESSPYLLQHAYNPVDWFPWCDEAWKKAREENKLVIVSVGYSSCHWCHVMEHESFEDDQVAEIMNKYFVSIKVDREERPDIDQVYMSAVQLMSGQGGWPLNCVTLPDGRPIYGGTYFPKENWKTILMNLFALFSDEKEKVEEYAVRLAEGVQLSDLVEADDQQQNIPDALQLELLSGKWAKSFDQIEGGPNRAPKFPLPNNYLFLLRYGVLSNDSDLLYHVRLTLDKMAMGGIFDQIGGGFSRYSVDMVWKVPHFEKMLYDNAQLISLYSEAYRWSNSPLYEQTVHKTIQFLLREMRSPEGGFFSALDADSEGKEGKFYVWKKDELTQLLGDDMEWVKEYYSINYLGEWEHGNYILLRREKDEVLAKKMNLDVQTLRQKVDKVNKVLLRAREKRARPGLDDKVLCSWNGMMVAAFCDAYKAFQKEEYLQLAEEIAHFIMASFLRSDGGLLHSWKGGEARINAFLEDYAFVIDGFVQLYEITGKEEWLKRAGTFASKVEDDFSDDKTPLFYFTAKSDAELFARKMELSDNVIPASNSVMARNFFLLSHYLGKEEWEKIAKNMLAAVSPQMMNYPAGWSNWMILALQFSFPFYEIALTGDKSDEFFRSMVRSYHPNSIYCHSVSESQLPLLVSRWKNGESWIYVCRNKSCNLPVQSVQQAIDQMQ